MFTTIWDPIFVDLGPLDAVFSELFDFVYVTGLPNFGQIIDQCWTPFSTTTIIVFKLIFNIKHVKLPFFFIFP